MGLRPGRCYRKHQRPYTRQSQRKPRKSYIKGVPKPKITQFEFGTKGDYTKVAYVISSRAVQIRHNSLEASRVVATQLLETTMPKGHTFFFKVLVYPHQVLRENALATGAGADRFQQGMRANFGRPISTAARVFKGQRIMEVRFNGGLVQVKEALKGAIYKLPTPCKIMVEDKVQSQFRNIKIHTPEAS